MSFVRPPRQLLCKAVHDKITSCGPVIRVRPALDLNYPLNGMTALQGRPPTSYTGASNKMFFNGDGLLQYAPHQLLENANLSSQSGSPLVASGWQEVIPSPATATVYTDEGGYFSILMTANGDRPSIVNNIPVDAGTTYTAFVYIHSFSYTSGSNIVIFPFGTSGQDGKITYSDFVNLGGTPGWYAVGFTMGAADTSFSFYLGIGSGSNGTGVQKLSRPGVIKGLLPGVGVDAPAKLSGPPLGEWIGTDDGDEPLYTVRDGAHVFDSATSAWVNRGYLPEEASTETFIHTESFDNVAWVKTRSSITANAAVAPDGNTTMDKLVEDSTASNSHYTRQTVTKTAAAETWTYNVFANKADYDDVTLWLSDGTTNRVQATFDLVAGTAGTATTGGTGFSAPVSSIEDVGGGIYRLRLTGTTNSDTSISGWVLLNNGAGTTYSGDGSSGTYIWGGNLIKSSIPLSYVPAAAAQVVQAADVATVALPGSFSAAEGNIYIEFYDTLGDLNTASRTLWQLSDQSINNQIYYTYAAPDKAQFSIYNGTFQMQSVEVDPSTGKHRFIASWKGNDGQTYTDGVSRASDTTITLPTGLNELAIGHRWNSMAYANIPVARITGWNYREQNPRLQTVTA